MSKIVKEIKEELGEVKFTPKGSKESQTLPAKTIYTYYTDGTNDCRLEIQKPLDIGGKTEEITKENK